MVYAIGIKKRKAVKAMRNEDRPTFFYSRRLGNGKQSVYLAYRNGAQIDEAKIAKMVKRHAGKPVWIVHLSEGGVFKDCWSQNIVRQYNGNKYSKEKTVKGNVARIVRGIEAVARRDKKYWCIDCRQYFTESTSCPFCGSGNVREV